MSSLFLSSMPFLDEPEILIDLLETFIRSTENRLNVISQHVEKKSATDIAKEAHAIKSAASSLNLMDFAKTCEAIEMHGRKNELDPAIQLCLKLQKDFISIKYDLDIAMKMLKGSAQ